MRSTGLRLMRKAIATLTIAGLLAIACAPSSINLSNATDDELDTACNALSKVGYDYYELNVLAIGGRTLEVAASIHTDHAGPGKTQKFCEGR